MTTKIRSLTNGYYPDLPPYGVVQARFAETLDWRYTEYFVWSAIMMRAITAAFDDELFRPGPVIAYGNSKNGMTPLISSIHDDRITAVRSTHAFTTYADPDPRAGRGEEVEAEGEPARRSTDELPAGDQPGPIREGFQNFIEAVGAFG